MIVLQCLSADRIQQVNTYTVLGIHKLSLLPPVSLEDLSLVGVLRAHLSGWIMFKIWSHHLLPPP